MRVVSPGAAGAPGRASWWGTVVFAVTAAVGAAMGSGPARAVALVVATVLFALGCVAFVWAYVVAVRRSRADVIGVAQLYLLTGDTAPPEVKRALLGALGVQVVVALATAIARPYTSLAAGTLVPVLGLGLCGLWAAREGRFRPRPPPGEGAPGPPG